MHEVQDFIICWRIKYCVLYHTFILQSKYFYQVIISLIHLHILWTKYMLLTALSALLFMNTDALEVLKTGN